ncbi:hypothetical protein CEXT_262551 [Caerostris extrusa]|uniref:Uncharacterized protein n=1 Tax=Caerostris extrusa TaxID=172846 RepID=A0AAV4R4G3_CAEEX|nr:hypothetical protein CEXT_262551 [Caerostris extrusa]
MALEENYQEILSSVHFDGKHGDLFRLPPCIIDIRFIMHVPQTKSPTLQLLRSDLEGRKEQRNRPFSAFTTCVPKKKRERQRTFKKKENRTEKIGSVCNCYVPKTIRLRAPRDRCDTSSRFALTSHNAIRNITAVGQSEQMK